MGRKTKSEWESVLSLDRSFFSQLIHHENCFNKLVIGLRYASSVQGMLIFSRIAFEPTFLVSCDYFQ